MSKTYALIRQYMNEDDLNPDFLTTTIVSDNLFFVLFQETKKNTVNLETHKRMCYIIFRRYYSAKKIP
jgi:hypothetical protein